MALSTAGLQTSLDVVFYGIGTDRARGDICAPFGTVATSWLPLLEPPSTS
jgi:hypothetical protein